ncbi:hypothetical protein [Marinisporobacter balticus]|uniref:Uncharacterized protein n=1 Tax=Marinisporobacter balticus TaxID=2018667 RepID=A0A4V2SA78_9FIRM|nr:hypothetical protein [Marinisporobacter balticus]TCO70400.1 hypothetical protein EV214_12620 [Marinisporobacter balticus]
MFTIPLVTAVVVGWPEVFIILLMGCYLSNIRKLNIYKITLIACIQAIITYETRKFSLVFGIHTLIHMVTLSLLVYFILNISFHKAVISVLIGTVLEGMVQSIMLPCIFNFYSIDASSLAQNSKYVPLCFIPIFIVSCLFILVIKKFNILIWDVEK